MIDDLRSYKIGILESAFQLQGNRKNATVHLLRDCGFGCKALLEVMVTEQMGSEGQRDALLYLIEHARVLDERTSHYASLQQEPVTHVLIAPDRINLYSGERGRKDVMPDDLIQLEGWPDHWPPIIDEDWASRRGVTVI